MAGEGNVGQRDSQSEATFMPQNIRISGARISGVAWRYARALFDLAGEQGAQEAVSADMDALARALEESEDFAEFVASPLLNAEQQGAVIDALAKKMKLQDLTARFLRVLAQNRRLALLGEVIAAFRQLQAQARGEMKVEAITAQELTASQRKKLAATLKKALSREVDIDNTVNPDIIGGLVLRVGSRMIDASVRQRLNALKGALKGV